MTDLKNYQQLDPLARGLIFRQVKEREGISYQEIARRIEKSPAYVVNSVRLLDLPEAIKDGLLGGLITEGHARALISIRDPKECVAVYKEVLKTHASVRETEELVRRALQRTKSRITEKKLVLIRQTLEKILEEKFRRPKIKESRKRVTIVLERQT